MNKQVQKWMEGRPSCFCSSPNYIYVQQIICYPVNVSHVASRILLKPPSVASNLTLSKFQSLCWSTRFNKIESSFLLQLHLLLYYLCSLCSTPPASLLISSLPYISQMRAFALWLLYSLPKCHLVANCKVFT